jgi:wobble nucleotide-excising tRNase
MNAKEEEVKEGRELHFEDYCPACFLMRAMKARRTRYRSFFDHLYNAQVEMLRAFRSLVDARIAAVEKRKSHEENEKRATKIEVE